MFYPRIPGLGLQYNGIIMDAVNVVDAKDVQKIAYLIADKDLHVFDKEKKAEIEMFKMSLKQRPN